MTSPAATTACAPDQAPRPTPPPTAVNNAGTNIKKPTLHYSEEEYQFIMSTNLDSAYTLCQLCHPMLKASGNASIVMVSSVAGGRAVGPGRAGARTQCPQALGRERRGQHAHPILEGSRPSHATRFAQSSESDAEPATT
jgi:NAD(P)-dependent dehydrogenase (short-subunit alcohol dehydrogenase family)